MSIRNAGEIASDAVKDALKAERARVRRLVRKELRERTKAFAIYRASSDPRDYILAKRVEGGMAACNDILNALKEGR